MLIIYILYLLVFVATVFVGIVCFRIKETGMNVKDFFAFIHAINDLDVLYVFSKNNTKMTEIEQMIFMKEAEKVFSKFEKVPSMIWEDEYEKYSQVLETYRNIKLLRWSEMAV
ncbi:MAG: hypothetical protein IKE01_07280 [Clostridia bacterium]|nr:hypothetical protein [Clostridia bacterium]